MNVTVAQVVAAIESWAPHALQESWDNTGLCVGEERMPVRGVLLALDCTEEVIDQAISMNLNMVVTHHPLIFKPLRHLTGQTSVEKAVVRAVKNDIAVFAAHTNADKVSDGVSRIMADKLGLCDCRILEGDADHEGCGLGLVGKLKTSMTTADFLHRIKEAFALRTFRYTRGNISHIDTVALSGGSGGSLIASALESGAQLFVSADFSYHQFLDTAPRMILVDIGHYESEIGILEHFRQLLMEKIPNFAAHITNINTNPIFYY